MTDSFTYDGTGKLSETLAKLYGVSFNNHNKIAELIKQAKTALAITEKARVMPIETKLLIYRWHYERIHRVTDAVEIFTQSGQIKSVGLLQQADAETVETFSQAEAVDIITQVNDKPSVNIVSQEVLTDAVEIISQPSTNKPVENISHTTLNKSVETISQATIHQSVDLFSQTRVAFYVQKHGKRERQVIALEGYYLNALAALGVNKANVPKWVQAAVDNWMAFDSELPITRQVKCLIVSALIDKAAR